MDVSVFGLGYVGVVCAACLAKRGHRIVGCDVQDIKVDAINGGTSPIQEPGLETLIKEGKKAGRLWATLDAAEAVKNSTISLICVGTPSRSDGDIDLSFLVKVCEQIGGIVADFGRPHTDEVIIPAIAKSMGAKDKKLVRLCVNPEFLREGTAIADFDHPPMIVVGEAEEGAGDDLVALYEGIGGPLFRVGLKEAVAVKYACNIFHAMKIIFGNEIGALCQAEGIDSHKVMDVFCQDKHLNISARYLKPGYAYGGSCLPKDLRAALCLGRKGNVETPLLRAIGQSNKLHIERCVQTVLSLRSRRIGVLGLSFKDDTDDLRESPTVEIAESLIGKGMEVAIHDKDVASTRIYGSNLTFIQQRLPHLASLMCQTPEEVIEQAEVVLLAKPSKLYADIETHLKSDQVLVDLVRFFDPGKFTACRYVGLVG